MKVFIISIVLSLGISCNLFHKKQNDENIEFNDVKGTHLIYPNTEINRTLKLAESFIYEYATSYHYEFTWWPEGKYIPKDKVLDFNQRYSYNIEKDWYCADRKSNVYIFDKIKIKEITQITGEFTGYLLDRLNAKSPDFKIPKNKALYVHYDLHVISNGLELERDKNSDIDKIVTTHITIHKKEDGQWGIFLPACYKYFTKQGFINYLYLESEIELHDKKNNEYTLKVIKKLKEKWNL